MKNKETFLVNKKYLKSALNLIVDNSKRRKVGLDQYGHRIKLQILDNCCHTPLVDNRRRASAEVLMTKTQRLLYQLKSAVGRHDWSSAASCVDFMLNLNGKLLPIVWKTVFLIMVNHKDSDERSLKKFFSYLGIRTAPEKSRFLEEILSLPVDLGVFNKRKKNK